MAKIICDVCGTSFPETAQQCPICGCVSAIDSDLVFDIPAEGEDRRESGYTYVKGGRFSKTNVKKKHRDEPLPSVNDSQEDNENRPKNSRNSKVFLAAAILVLLMIIAVVIFLTVHFFSQGTPGSDESTGTTTIATESTEATTEPTETTQPTTVETVPPVPCEEISISKTEIQLDKVGASVLLNVTLKPVDTTDEVVYTSSNQSVATVSNTGKVTAVAGGEAVITVSCGDVSATCKVTCTMAGGVTDTTEPTQGATEPTTESTEKPTEPDSDFALTDSRGRVYSDITLTFKGENYKLYNGDVPLDQITWTSDNERIATFVAGVVKATGRGVTEIHAEYNGVKRTCIVRCSDSVGSADSSGGDTSADSGSAGTTQAGPCKISHEDVTIRVGETFVLSLVKENGDPVFATWSVGNSSVCSASNNIITGLAKGMTTVSYTYEGANYSCIVRVV